MVYSEAGGVAKTTTAVSIANTAAIDGRRVVLIDLDPRSATTKWLQAKPVGEGYHVGAILGNPDSQGWAVDLAVSVDPKAGWSKNLRVIPSSVDLANVEGERADLAEFRLQGALEDLDADLVVIDCPNRPGGILTMNAAYASDRVVYAAVASDSGLDGVLGARRTMERFNRVQARRSPEDVVLEAGAVITRDGTGFLSISEQEASAQIQEQVSRIGDLVPHLSIVPECRMAGTWYGRYSRGTKVQDAYTQIMREVVGDE